MDFMDWTNTGVAANRICMIWNDKCGLLDRPTNQASQEAGKFELTHRSGRSQPTKKQDFIIC